MAYYFSNNVWNVFICSYCGRSLEKINSGAACPGCNQKYQYTDSGSLDLRLKKTKKYQLEFDIELTCFLMMVFSLNHCR